MTDNANKTALITGSNRGIGLATAKRFAAAGFNVCMHARKKTDEFSAVIEEIESTTDSNISAVYFDVSCKNEIELEIENLLKQNHIDVLVNNAGVLHEGLFLMTPIDTIKEIFEINLFAAMTITQYVAHDMLRKKSGSIINLASEGGIHQRRGDTAYGTSKAAVIAWTKALAAELGPFGIRVNAVAPGATNTRMVESMNDKTRDEHLKKCYLRRLAKPEEIADAIFYLASDNASFITGHVLSVDGGII